jgi:hypothetical protein
LELRLPWRRKERKIQNGSRIKKLKQTNKIFKNLQECDW